MAGVKIGSVAVDLTRTLSQFENGVSSGAKHDTRCILYTEGIRSHHRFVRVRAGSSTDAAFVYAELRRSANSSAWISKGLLQALRLQPPLTNEKNDVALEVFGAEEPVDTRGCVCSMGSLSRVQVAFSSRKRPPKAVTNALEQSIRMFLQREIISEKHKLVVHWFNQMDEIEYAKTKFSSTGSGCCDGLGIITDATAVDIKYSKDSVDDANEFVLPSVAGCVSHVDGKLGGVHGHASQVCKAIIRRLQDSKEDASQHSSIGAIFSGLPGIGKTALGSEICASFASVVPIRYMSGADVFQTYVGHSEAHIVRVFEGLMQAGPGILFIDGLESIAPSRDRFIASDSSLEVGVLGTFLACLDRIKRAQAHVFIIGTTNRIEDVDAAVFSNGRMDTIVRMEPPSLNQRQEILSRMVAQWELGSMDKSALVAKVSDSTGGFVAADLLSLCQKALQACLNGHQSSDITSPVVTIEHFEDALQSTFPSVLQAHHVSLRSQTMPGSASNNAFKGLYGVDEALRTIQVSLFEPLRDCSRFIQFGTMPPKGILLTGPPGSGKTHLANVVGADLRRRGLASFVSVRCTDLLTKVVGDTEKTLRELFETARSAAPCVIYFDQIESIAPVRGFDTSTEQTFDRLLSMLLVEMDGFSSSREAIQASVSSNEARDAFLKNHVVILASTNRTDSLDPAILRPGRFDVHMELNLPNRVAREQIVLDTLAPVPIDFASDQELVSPTKLAAFIAEKTERFTAGDLTSLLREAAMSSMREDFKKPVIAIRHIRDALDQHLEVNASSKVAAHTPMRGERRRPTPHLGDQLHPRNRYKDNRPDFYVLGQRYPSFFKHLRNVDDNRKTATLPFDDPVAVRELTRTLLLHDFGLDWTMPLDRLCPPLPNRLNYIHWIEDLLHGSGVEPFPSSSGSGNAIRGIDIGTGASCIYALLGAKMNGWNFVATEIDADSFEVAAANVSRNDLGHLIHLQRVSTSRLLCEPLKAPPSTFDKQQIHFSMCNPPFFNDISEADTNPDSVCMGNASEMVYPGGEVAFISHMIEDSLAVRDRVLLYTSMIGKKASLRELLAKMRTKGINNVCSIEFFQGRTKRWGIAWSFSPAMSLHKEAKVLGKRKEASRQQQLTFDVPMWSSTVDNGCKSIDELVDRVKEFAASDSDLVLERTTDETTFQLRRQVDGAASASDAATGFTISVQIGEESDGYIVTVSYESGKREDCWRTAERLKAATVRSGRVWRRKRANPSA